MGTYFEIEIKREAPMVEPAVPLLTAAETRLSNCKQYKVGMSCMHSDGSYLSESEETRSR